MKIDRFLKFKYIYRTSNHFLSFLIIFLSVAYQVKAETPPKLVVSASTTLGDLPKDIYRIYSQIQPDPAPPQLARNSNYVVSNENHQERYYPTLSKKKGGVYLGVGVDQNYLMAAWSKPDVLLLFDFDQMVVHLHRVYRILFLHAKTPQEFLALWDKDLDTQKRVQSWITEEYGVENPENKGEKKCVSICKSVSSAYKISRALVKARLSFLARKYHAEQIPSFVSDSEQYQYIVNLYQTHRVFFLRGDLSKMALCRVSDAIAQTNMKIATIYLSNAENYFSYTPPSHFKECMTKLPTDANSTILHTWALQNRGNKYAYFTQAAENFKAWLQKPGISKFAKIVYSDYYPLFHSWRAQEKIHGIKYPPPQLIVLEKQPSISKKNPSMLLESKEK